MVGAPNDARLIDLLARLIGALVLSWVSQKMVFFIAKVNKEDLTIVIELITTGKGNTGHRPALQLERGPGSSAVSGGSTRSRKSSNNSRTQQRNVTEFSTFYPDSRLD
jgi:hypothetical protein